MISYRLKCGKDHEFDAWFASSAAFDAQVKAGQLDCPHCGSRQVTKSVMAPNVAPRSNRGQKAAAAVAPAAEEVAAQLREFREHVEKTSENVGDRFAEEARKIHNEEADARSIYGSATSNEAESLLEEGVKFYPMPALPEEQN